MTIPTTKRLPAEGCWRIVCWQGDDQKYTQRRVKNWLVSRVSTPDGCTFEIGAGWTSPDGAEVADDTAVLVPMAILPPGDHRTVDDVAQAYAAGRGLELPYAVSPRGFTGAVRHAVEGGDERLKHLLDLGQRLVIAASLESANAAVQQPNPETTDAVKTFSCPLCDLKFRDPWITGTHRGSVHRYNRPDCAVCGTRRCSGPLGDAIHSSLVQDEEDLRA